jgi:hypothetical protein
MPDADELSFYRVSVMTIVRARPRNLGLPFPANLLPCSFWIAELWLYVAALPCSTGSSSPSSASGKSIAAAPAQSIASSATYWTPAQPVLNLDSLLHISVSVHHQLRCNETKSQRYPSYLC